MTGISVREKAIPAIAVLCLLLCGGTFFTQDHTQPVRSRSTEAVTVTEPTQSDYPDSLLPGERIDLNTAPPRDLARLPGIGEKRAEEICRHREEHGPFQTVDELVLVYGIGEVTLENLRQYITVS